MVRRFGFSFCASTAAPLSRFSRCFVWTFRFTVPLNTMKYIRFARLVWIYSQSILVYGFVDQVALAGHVSIDEMNLT